MVKFECPACGYVMQTAQFLNGKGHCLKCQHVVATSMNHPLNPDWTKKMRSKFDALNTDGKTNSSGIGTLDFDEMSALLRKGNPDMSDKELRMLFDAADTNGNGTIEFTEFLWFLYGGPSTKGAGPGKGAGNPRSKTPVEGSGPGGGEAGSVEEVFLRFCGGQQTMDSKSFAKMCKDCKLVDKKLTVTDVDLTFSKVCPKGQRRITLQHFEQAMRIFCEKKSVEYADLAQKVLDAGAPVINATKAQATRFHDDKSTYTGTHAGK